MLELLMIYKLAIIICLLQCEQRFFPFEYTSLDQCKSHIQKLGFNSLSNSSSIRSPRCVRVK